jgi:maleate isomerase
MRPEGVTFHYSRCYVEEPDLSTDQGVQDFIDALGQANDVAIRNVLTCKPSFITMGMSGETFWGGAEGNEAFEKQISTTAGLPISTGASAVRAALEAYGAKKLAFVSPYPPIVNEHVIRYFNDHGYEVTADHGLGIQSATAIAEVTEDTLAKVLLELNESNPDVIVQAGTNLSMVRLAAAAERFLGKPVIAINTACVWHTLRQLGINDQYSGFGSLLSDH